MKSRKKDPFYPLVLIALALLLVGIVRTLPEAIDHNLGRLSAPVVAEDLPPGFDRYRDGLSQIEAHNRVRQELAEVGK